MNNTSKGIKPIIIIDDETSTNEDISLKIKEAQFMGSPSESNWYDDVNNIQLDSNKIIDNNESVDLEQLQWLKVKEEQEKEAQKIGSQNMATKEVKLETTIVSSISDIKNSIIEKKKLNKQLAENTKQEVNTGIKLNEGEFAVLFRNKLAENPTKDVERIKQICEQLIIKTEDIKDNDIVVMLRIPLKKLFS